MTPQEQQQFQEMQQQIAGLLGEFNNPAGRIPKLEAQVKNAPIIPAEIASLPGFLQGIKKAWDTLA